MTSEPILWHLSVLHPCISVWARLLTCSFETEQCCWVYLRATMNEQFTCPLSVASSSLESSRRWQGHRTQWLMRPVAHQVWSLEYRCWFLQAEEMRCSSEGLSWMEPGFISANDEPEWSEAAQSNTLSRTYVHHKVSHSTNIYMYTSNCHLRHPHNIHFYCMDCTLNSLKNVPLAVLRVYDPRTEHSLRLATTAIDINTRRAVRWLFVCIACNSIANDFEICRVVWNNGTLKCSRRNCFSAFEAANRLFFSLPFLFFLSRCYGEKTSYCWRTECLILMFLKNNISRCKQLEYRAPMSFPSWEYHRLISSQPWALSPTFVRIHIRSLKKKKRVYFCLLMHGRWSANDETP